MSRATITALERWLAEYRELPPELRQDIQKMIELGDRQRLEIETLKRKLQGQQHTMDDYVATLKRTIEELRRDQADDATLMQGLETALAVARHELKSRREAERLERGD